MDWGLPPKLQVLAANVKKVNLAGLWILTVLWDTVKLIQRYAEFSK